MSTEIEQKIDVAKAEFERKRGPAFLLAHANESQGFGLGRLKRLRFPSESLLGFVVRNGRYSVIAEFDPELFGFNQARIN